MLTTLLAAGLLAATTAHAGKLADGFRGLPYGDIAVLDKAPMPGCITPDEKTGVKWACPTSIGNTPVEVYYMAGHGLYYGTLIKSKGYVNSRELRAALKGAWGDPVPGGPDLTVWLDDDVVGSMEYNRALQETIVVLVNQPLHEQYKQLAAAAARAAGKGDL